MKEIKNNSNLPDLIKGEDQKQFAIESNISIDEIELELKNKTDEYNDLIANDNTDELKEEIRQFETESKEISNKNIQINKEIEAVKKKINDMGKDIDASFKLNNHNLLHILYKNINKKYHTIL